MDDATRTNSSQKPRWQSSLETAAVVAIASAIVWQVFLARHFTSSVAVQAQAARRPAAARPPEPPPPSEPISIANAATRGSTAAKVALVLFSDYQCPFCGRFERDTLPALVTKYVTPGQVELAFVEFPLSIHPFAEKAAEAAECAGAAGKFWAMHDQLFQHQQQLDEPSLATYASTIGVTAPAFTSCLAGQQATKVAADQALGKTLGVSGTPTFFIGQIQQDGRVKATARLSGAQPVAQFQAALDKALADSRATGTK